MEILIFLLVLIALIVVHEFGHFVAAKLSGMRVDEFGLGYPPRAATIAKIGETRYTLNWIPFGGFVKIHGEDPLSEPRTQSDDARAFSAKPRILQATVLVAGILMNLLFAYVLITSALIAGTPRALGPDEVRIARDIELMVADVLPNSPAARAGLAPGDTIVSAVDSSSEWLLSSSLSASSAGSESFTKFISASNGRPIILSISKNGSKSTVTVNAEQGIIPDETRRYALGVEVATVGVVPLPFLSALSEGASLTWGTITLTAQGLAHFFYSIFTLTANFSQVAGPIGIAGVVGSASAQGFGNLFSIIAVISINLALINLIPIPALDGGRLLFVAIEGIIRRPIKPSIAQTVNNIGFAFLLLLMLVVSAHDIFKIIG